MRPIKRDALLRVRLWLRSLLHGCAMDQSIKRFLHRYLHSTLLAFVVLAAIPTLRSQPIFLLEPLDANVQAGGTVTLRTVVFGEDPTVIQWFFNGMPLQDGGNVRGVNTENLEITGITAAQAGSYFAAAEDPTGVDRTREIKVTVRGGSLPSVGWTIFVFGHGDHNLSQSLIEDLQEMEEAGSGPGFEIIVQADFDASAPNRGLPPDLAAGVTRFRMTQDSDSTRITSQVVERLPESKNMDDPQVLAEFLSWGFAKYPAQRYGLVMWDHGGQWVGFGGDSQDGSVQETGLMRTGQIREVVSQAMAAAGVRKLDFVSFDTCLMGGIEVLPDMVPLTDVYIACPELDYGDGWNYGPTLRYLKENPNVSALDFAKREVELWREQHMQPGKASDLALAAHVAYDLTQFAQVLQRFQTFGSALRQSAGPDNVWLPRLRLQATEYSVSDVKDIGQPTDYVDLGDLARLMETAPLSTAALKTSARELAEALDRLVVAKIMGTSKSKASGLSVYYPVAGSSAGSPYFEISSSKSEGATWPGLLDTVSKNRLLDVSAPSVSLLDSSSGQPSPGVVETVLIASVASPARIQFAINQGADAVEYSASMVSSRGGPDKDLFIYLGEAASQSLGGAGIYEFSWDTRIPVISDASGKASILGAHFAEPGSSLLVSFAVYSPPNAPNNQQVVLLLTEKSDGNTLKVVDVLDAETGSLAPVGIDVLPGGTLHPVFYAEKRMGPTPENWISEIITSPDAVTIPPQGVAGLKVDMSPVDPGEFDIEVQVLDAYQNESRVLTFHVRVVGDESPSLTIARSPGGDVTLSWSDRAPGGFVLESSPGIGNGAAWQTVDLRGATREGDSVRIVQPVGTGARFYRLRKP